MSENKECALYLGVCIAEKALSHYFENIQRMPHGNPGFDFICGKGFKIDVKSSTRYYHPRAPDIATWYFNIHKNQIADYFLCLAFDNRESLNPEHVWLIPGFVVNDRGAFQVSITKLADWEKYERPINKVIACCDQMKAEKQEA